MLPMVTWIEMTAAGAVIRRASTAKALLALNQSSFQCYDPLPYQIQLTRILLDTVRTVRTVLLQAGQEFVSIDL